MVTNRLEAYFASMVKPAETDDDVDAGTEAEPKNAFAKNLCEAMTHAGVDIDELAENTGIHRDRIRTLRSSGIPSAAKARKPKELKAIADALGTTVKALFGAEEKVETKVADMVQLALKGPKKSFLMDAIEMAYVAAIHSRSNY